MYVQTIIACDTWSLAWPEVAEPPAWDMASMNCHRHGVHHTHQTSFPQQKVLRRYFRTRHVHCGARGSPQVQPVSNRPPARPSFYSPTWIFLALDQNLCVPPHARLVRPALPRTVATGKDSGRGLGVWALRFHLLGMHNAGIAVVACTSLCTRWWVYMGGRGPRGGWCPHE